MDVKLWNKGKIIVIKDKSNDKESLDLSFNRLNKIENLDMLVNLKKLFLVHNHFTKIENIHASVIWI